MTRMGTGWRSTSMGAAEESSNAELGADQIAVEFLLLRCKGATDGCADMCAIFEKRGWAYRIKPIPSTRNLT